MRCLCISKLLPCCAYAGSTVEYQCFEIQIKTEADSNEYSREDKPSTGMFAVSDDMFSALSTDTGIRGLLRGMANIPRVKRSC